MSRKTHQAWFVRRTFCAILFLGLMGSTGDGRACAGEPTLTPVERLQQIDALIERYFRGKSLETSREDLKRAIKEHNRRVKAGNEEQTAELARLNQQVQAIEELDKLTDEMDARLAAKPDLSDASQVDAYNLLLKERNERVKEFNDLIASHKVQKQAYREFSEQSEREIEARRTELTAREAEFKQKIEDHRQWFQSGEDLVLFKSLNRLYAQLHGEKQAEDTLELAELKDKVRSIRRELFEYVIDRHQQAGTGAVVVEATLPGGGPCFLLVDTGAVAVTVPPSLVEVWGLSDQFGEEVFVTVAGGARIRGRELIIPQMSVQGQSVKDVRAIVLDEFDAGVDGVLGMSFLKRFVFRVDLDSPDKLQLEPRESE